MPPNKPMVWANRGNRANDTEYCACCNRRVQVRSRHRVVVTADMAEAIHPTTIIDDADTGGWFTVGPTCADKFLAGYTRMYDPLADKDAERTLFDRKEGDKT